MKVENALEKYDGDVYLYYGGISRAGYGDLSQAMESKEQKKNKACLILITYGGNPDAGYRIARAMRHHYKNVEILIPDACKSAGTLLCIGANKLIFEDRGELGPLDIQLSKPDEMFESMSGLDIIQALNALEGQVLKSFRSYLIDIKGGCQLRTKMTADIAVKLTEGFIAPIAAKIDPVTLGEHQRAMQIAFDYGERLNKKSESLKEGALNKLIGSYPSHGFVIDRQEAKDLFNNVSSPDKETNELYLWARSIVENKSMPQQPIVVDVACVVNGVANGDDNESNDKNNNVSAAKRNKGNSGRAKQKSSSNEPVNDISS